MPQRSTEVTSGACVRCEWSKKRAAADGCCEDQVRRLLLCVTMAQEASPECGGDAVDLEQATRHASAELCPRAQHADMLLS